MQCPNPKRKCLSLEQKLKVVELASHGRPSWVLARQFGVCSSTVRRILNQRNTLSDLVGKKPMSMKKNYPKDPIIETLENTLKDWIILKAQFHVPLTKAIIQAKALAIYEDLKKSVPSTADIKDFSASTGWLCRYIKREDLRNMIRGETTSDDVEAETRFTHEFAKTVSDGGYTSAQIFNVDETELLWNMLGTVKGMPGCKASKDRVTLLLGGNADGSLKLKPVLIDKYMKPRALKNCSKEYLPVSYKAQSKAWMTSDLFVTWFKEEFKPEIERFCEENKLPFKILLTMDYAPCHRVGVSGLFEEITVVFFPPNTKSYIQPMEQGIISNFKSYYLRDSFHLACANVDAAENLDKENALERFCKNFNIADVIKLVSASWGQVTQKTLTGAWGKILPSSNEVHGDIIEDLTQDIRQHAIAMDLDLTDADIRNILDSDETTLTENDILVLEEENDMSEPQEEELEVENSCANALKKHIHTLIDHFATLQKFDNDIERGLLARKKLEETIYELYPLEKE